MTNSHEPSYYEIALTNRQVVVAFVILLLCLVSAFFSGLWIGRESSARAQERIVRDVPPSPAAPQEGQALDELAFFEDEQKPGSGETAVPDATPAPAQDTTLLEDFGGEPDEVTEPDPDLPEGRRRRGSDRDAAGEEDGEEIAAAATPTPAPTPARAAAAATPEPRIAAGQVVIQVFSSPEQDQAEKVRDRLLSGGHKAYLSPVQVSGRTMHRVRIGPFSSRGDAQKVAEQVRKGYKLDTWVTE
ncbi:MAG TPA: SPOR domain-containing protein [Thermoanaerobaculia bacterium]|nr:SPOR domain-containing protein [Thermoanaerobaculia bacterium]